ncbi:early activation antigen CD69 [Orycteropus afer afer]|uniref:Early activation antigen CD69 n=1 Tax=Orycteropus afer afer TaxID=1230840 RepID=A0A8B6ZIA5_ORYAF|nr:early activation antigen CD69 [Orycteropus afer afer]
MDVEGYMEDSSLNEEEGKQSNATSSHFTAHHEGSLQVPVPCAVVNVVLITILIIALIALSVGQYNCPGQYIVSVPSASHVSPCSNDWVGYQKKCFLISTMRRNWTSAQSFCSEQGATLALIDPEKEMNFLKRYVGRTEHWIALKNETDQIQKLSDSKGFNNRFNIDIQKLNTSKVILLLHFGVSTQGQVFKIPDLMLLS